MLKNTLSDRISEKMDTGCDIVTENKAEVRINKVAARITMVKARHL